MGILLWTKLVSLPLINPPAIVLSVWSTTLSSYSLDDLFPCVNMVFPLSSRP